MLCPLLEFSSPADREASEITCCWHHARKSSDPRGMRFLRPCLVSGSNRKLWTRMIAYLAAGKKKPIEVTAKDLKPFNPKKKQLEKAPIGLLAVLLVTVSVLLGTMVWLIRRRA